MNQINLFDVVALTTNLPKYGLFWGEVGTVVEVHPKGGYEVEFVAQDGYTYALISAKPEQLISLKQKPMHRANSLVVAAL